MQQDTLEPFDVILGIDGCEDTLDYFNYELIEYPVKAIYLPENKGTYITTNTLINMVDEGLILRFDSDDEMLPFMISDLLELELGVRDVGAFPCFNFDGNVKKVYTATHGCLAFNKELFNELGGYKPWRCAADTDFLNRARCLGVNLKINQRPTFNRRIHENSLTQHPDTNYRSGYRKSKKKEIARKFERVCLETSEYEIIR